MHWVAQLSFWGYLSLVLSVAIVAYFVTNNLSDFVLGGRRLSGAVAALSSGASDMSAWLLLGLPGAAYTFGLSQIWLPIGLTVGAYLNWRLLAKPLRVFTEVANDALTVPAFLDNRFLSQSTKAIRLVSAAATLTFFAIYTASGLVGGALLMNSAFGLPYWDALLAGTGIIMLYTLVGGFLAVSWTDFFQGIFMFCCLAAVPFYAIEYNGGLQATWHVFQTLRPSGTALLEGLSALGLINLLAWGLGYFGQPHILVRFMAIRSTKDIPLARRVLMSWMTLSLGGAIVTGLVGVVYFQDQISNPESVFIEFSRVIFSPWVAGVILGAILSSIMCAIDSQMLASSSALTEDIYRAILRPKATQTELVWCGRLTVLLIAVAAVMMAYLTGKNVLDLVGVAWAGLAATFAAPVVGALFWRRMSATGAWLGMAAGGLTSIMWSIYTPWPIYEIIPGIVISSLGVILGSRWRPVTSEQVQLFDEAWVAIRQS